MQSWRGLLKIIAEPLQMRSKIQADVGIHAQYLYSDDDDFHSSTGILVPVRTYTGAAGTVHTGTCYRYYEYGVPRTPVQYRYTNAGTGTVPVAVPVVYCTRYGYN